MLQTLSKDELPASFSPYGAIEVSKLRQAPESDVIGRRAALLAAMRQQGVLGE